MKYKKMIIEYGDDNFPVEYNLFDYAIVQKWAERVISAQAFPYEIDHPNRFYGFDPLPIQISNAIAEINQLCNKIESYGINIGRRLNDVTDQDTLNYLHSIFEQNHGLLDCKLSDGNLEKHLCNLNIAVHRCESIQRGSRPRHVVTYFGLPKTKILDIDDYQHFTDEFQFGTVYLNYAEIGKTFEDLALDNDKYISNEAFQPFKHYSADFNVKFYNTDSKELLSHLNRLQEYYLANKDFFDGKGLTADSPYLRSGAIPLAHMITKIKLDDIKSRQLVKSVRLYG